MDKRQRGFREIKETLSQRVHKGSSLVFDGWPATAKAAKAIGYKNVAPPVVHERHWRDPETGWHTNDVESENNRIKRWSRKRYGRLLITSSDMDEYIYYTNVGRDIVSVMRAVALASGGLPADRNYSFMRKDTKSTSSKQ